MGLTAKEVFKRARVVLNDATSTRWSLPELLMWLNDAVREIAVLSPEAVSGIAAIEMDEGTLQTMPASVQQILRVVCNVTVKSGPPFVYERGDAVTPIRRALLDAIEPGWQDPDVVPFTRHVAHFVEDETLQGYFYVCPGNTGAGMIECIVARRPAEIDAPDNPFEIDSYDGIEVQVDQRLQNAVVDFVVSRALAKDLALPGAEARSMAHYQRFAGAVMARQSNEVRVNPTTAPPAPSP